MLACYLLDSDNNFVGVLNNDFTFTASKDTRTICKASFYKGDRHLFVSEFDSARTLKKDETMAIKFHANIDFYYIATKIKEPFQSAKDSLLLYRILRGITKEIIHERKARNKLNTWDKQVYTVLFNEK